MKMPLGSSGPLGYAEVIVSTRIFVSRPQEVAMRARLVQLVNLAFWILVAFASARYVAPKWQEFHLSSRLSSVSLGWLGLAMAVLVLQYLAVFEIWRRILLLLGAEAPVWSLFRPFGLSLLPKYIPGRVFGPGLRARLAARAGLPYPPILGSLIWETGLGLATAVLIAFIAFVPGLAPELTEAARWLALTVIAGALAGWALTRVPKVHSVLATWLYTETILRQLPKAALLFLAYVGIWAMSAIAHWMLARSIAPLAPVHFLPLLVALCTSWALGMLSLFAPAGLGVREGVLYIFAKSMMPAPAALLFVTVSRLTIFGVEIVMTLLALAATSTSGPQDVAVVDGSAS
jgi:glycosyltransferase 2 family protein